MMECVFLIQRKLLRLYHSWMQRFQDNQHALTGYPGLNFRSLDDNKRLLYSCTPGTPVSSCCLLFHH